MFVFACLLLLREVRSLCVFAAVGVGVVARVGVVGAGGVAVVVVDVA